MNVPSLLEDLPTARRSPSPAVRGLIVAIAMYAGIGGALAAPDTPTGLSGKVTGNTVELSWTADESGATAGYNVYGNNRYLTTVFDAGYTATIDPTALTAYAVVAFGGEPLEFSPASAAIDLPADLIPTDLTVPPSAPTNLDGEIVGSTVTLSWTASTDDEAVRGYNVYQDDAYLTTVFDTRYTGSVIAGSAYSWYVVAFDFRSNFSTRSERLRLPDAGPVDTTIPPSTPTGLAGDTAAAPGNALTATLSWQASTDDQAVAGYNVYTDGAYTTTVFSTTYETLVPADDVTTFSVVAFDRDENFSAQSESLILPDPTLSDPDALTEPPTTPDNLAGDIDGTRVSLTWSASTDNIDVGGYNVYRDDRYLTTVLEPSYQGTVDADTVYTFYVVAFDRNDNYSGRSVELSLMSGPPRSSAQPPEAPTNLSGSLAANGDGFSIDLRWDEATDDGVIAGYNVYRNNAYLTTVSGTAYQDRVDDAGPYSYYVVAFDVPRNFSAASDRISVPDNGNQPPFFIGFEDQVIEAGQRWTFVVRPADSDGGAPGLLGGRLPAGMSSTDALDGTRRLSWRPLQPDVGDYDITFTAFDSLDPSLSTTATITVTVVLPEDLSTIPNVGPTIDRINPFVVRSGDTINLRVKAVDANGTVPALEVIDPPVGSTFERLDDEDRIGVFRWTPDVSNLGAASIAFRATDAEDESLTFRSDASFEIVEPAVFDRPGRRLRELAEQRGILFGYAHLLAWYDQPDGELYADIAAEEFNILSTENSLKMGYIYPEPDRYRFEGADAEMAFARENDIQVHGHPLIWYSVLPPWILNSDPADREGIMLGFIDTVVSRYRDDVTIWDVVNEALDEDGSFRDSVWFEAMGEAHIDLAFRRARANAPDATLLYNDYGVSVFGPKADAMYALVQRLLEDGVPIDGVGFQMHLTSSFARFDEVAANFQRFADLGVNVYITELDVALEAGDDEDDQAAVFADAVATCLAQPGCRAVQIWGFTDRYSWLGDREALVLDRRYQPKAAYGALQNVLVP